MTLILSKTSSYFYTEKKKYPFPFLITPLLIIFLFFFLNTVFPIYCKNPPFVFLFYFFVIVVNYCLVSQKQEVFKETEEFWQKCHRTLFKSFLLNFYYNSGFFIQAPAHTKRIINLTIILNIGVPHRHSECQLNFANFTYSYNFHNTLFYLQFCTQEKNKPNLTSMFDPLEYLCHGMLITNVFAFSCISLWYCIRLCLYN